MNIQIIGDNLEISDSNRLMIEDKVASRLDKLLTKFDNDMKTASMRIIKDKLGNFIINFDMNLPGKTHIYATTTHKVFESALIDLAQEVEKQIQKYKDVE
jgi:ribosome-associated translation inhibitor RaiA